MSVTTSVFIACSLDGYIARSDGSLDWLTAAPGAAGETQVGDYGYAEFLTSVDTIVLGRTTYETVLGFELEEWPYGARPVYVMTTQPGRVVVPEEITDRVEVFAGSPAELLETLETAGLRHAYVDGGRTIQSFLAAGIIDNLTITRLPVLLGAKAASPRGSRQRSGPRRPEQPCPESYGPGSIRLR